MFCSPCSTKQFFLAIFMLMATAAGGLVYDVFRLEQHFMVARGAGEKEAIILVCMGTGDTGMERCVVLQQQAFIDAGIDSVLICHRGSYIAKTALERKLPVIICSNAGICSKRFAWLPGVQRAISTQLQRCGKRLLAIQCNMPRELFAAKRAAAGTKIPVIFTQHTMHNIVSKELRQAADGFIGMSRGVTEQFAALNEQEGIACPMLALPPYFAYERFLSVKPQEVREVFFKEQFGVTLKPIPLLLKVAHLYPELHIKNHPLLLRAMHELIHNRRVPVQVALAGSGKQDALKQMVHDLRLDGYVHFLGCTDRTPKLFYYADINVLASSKEAFGMALAEGGLLAKPTIIATGTGAAGWLITNNETGFLFENNDAMSLADTIAAVLADPAKARVCGQRLRERVLADFLPPQTVAKTLAFYRAVGKRLTSL